MTSFSYVSPTKICFGRGVLQQLPNELTSLGFGRRLLLVTDNGIVRAGIADDAINILQSSGYTVTMFSDVQANPRDIDCIDGTKRFLARWCDAVVALGGGSAMDTAKTISLLARHGGTPSDYVDNGRFYGETAPLACIPTTAGTGSEVTRGAVITESQTHRKMTLKHDWMRPKLALLDPELTMTVPQSVTAATGVDALVHAMEGYTCTLSQPIAKAFGAQAMPLIIDALPKAYPNPSDIEARSDMLLGSLLAGLCFGSSDVASVHCLAEALGGLYDTPHGLANAVFLRPVLEFNIIGHEPLHAELARKMGFASRMDSTDAACEKLLAGVAGWLDQLHIPSLSELPHVQQTDARRIVELAFANKSTPSNVRIIDTEGYASIVERAFQAQS